MAGGHFRKAFILILLATLTSLPAFAQVLPGLSCVAAGGVPLAVRAGGRAELSGEVILFCTGGSPNPEGMPLPTTNFQLTIGGGLQFTSRNLNAANQASEALVLIDEPAPIDFQPCPLSFSPCSANGTGIGTYNGPNVIQGQQTSPTTILFPNVPFDPPSDTQPRVFRFTNLRVTAPDVTGSTPAPINVTLSSSGAVTVPITNPTATVAAAVRGLAVSLADAANLTALPSGGLAYQQCVGNNVTLHQSAASSTAAQGRSFTVRFTEQFGAAFKRAVTAAPVTQDFPPNPAAQDMAGFVYNTEWGFYSPLLPITGGMNSAGAPLPSNYSTRVYARFTAPAGVKLFAPVRSAVLSGATQTGTARLVNADNIAYGAFDPTASTSSLESGLAPLPFLSGSHWAVFDIITSDPFVIERVSVPIYAAFDGVTTGVGNITVYGGFAPILADTSVNSAAVPRFLDNATPQLAATISACAPPPPVEPPPPPLTITTPAMSSGTVGRFYSFQFSASGGGPYTWSDAGGLPAGLSMNPQGVVSGTPAESGNFTVTVEVSNERASALKSFSLTILPRVELRSGCPASPASLGVAYSQTFTARGGTPPYTFFFFGGRLPAGLSIGTSGTLSGTPTEAGGFEFTVQVTDAQQTIARTQCSINVVGNLAVEPSSIEFQAISNGPTPPSRILQVAGDGTGLGVEIVSSTQSGGDWIRTAQRSGGTPFLVEVTADPTGLPAADYTGTVEFRIAGMPQSTRRVAVRFGVAPPQPARLNSEPGSVQGSLVRGSTGVTRELILSNRGSGSLSFSGSIEYQSGQDWLDASPLSGSLGPNGTAPLTVNLRPAALGLGSYAGRVRLRVAVTNQELVIPVVLGVTPAGVSMQASQSGLSFTAVSGGPAPLAESVDITASGDGSFNWSAAASVDDGLPAWLSVSRSSGASGSSTEVRVSPSGLAPGSYFGQVRFDAQGVNNGPRFVFTALRVLPANSAVDLAVRPAGLLFTSAAAQTITVFNASSAAVRLESQLQQQGAFMITQPLDLNLGPGASAMYRATPNVTGRAPGVYRTTLTFRAVGGGRVALAELVLIVPPAARTASEQPRTTETGAGAVPYGTGGPRRSLFASVERFAEALCPPGGLQIVSVNRAIGFSSVTGLPLPMEVRVAANDGQPFVSGAVTAAFSGTSAAAVNLVSIPTDPGRWSGTLQPPSQPSGPISLRLSAQDTAGTRTGCLDLSGSLESTDAPVIAENGVLSAASLTPGGLLAPGGLISIFGVRLAAGSTTSQSVPLPPVLGQTRVTIGGRSVPLFFAGDQGALSQVNALLPYGLPPGVPLQLTLRRGSAGLAFASVLLSDAQPGLFTADQTGGGQGVVVLGSRPTVIANAANPARIGEPVVIYCEGLGATTPPVDAGTAAPSSPLAVVPGVRVTIGGIEAQVAFAGLSPGSVGLYQVNAAVPAGVTPGTAVPVVVSVAGQVSRTVTMAVQ